MVRNWSIFSTELPNLIRNSQFLSLTSNFDWHCSIFWVELDDFYVNYGQFLSLMTKTDVELYDFLARIDLFMNRKVQFFWLIYFCLIFVDFLIRINIFFIRNGQFLGLTSTFCLILFNFFGRNWTIFLLIMVNFET